MHPLQLQEGCAYYHVRWSDPARTIPALEPLIYVGDNILSDDDPTQKTSYFQDTVSYFNPALEREVTPFSADQVGRDIVTLEGALAVIEEALRRSYERRGGGAF